MQRLLVVIVAMLLSFGACESQRSQSQPGVLNLNQATVAELEKLPGIGDKHARSIVAARNARGGQFDSLDQLLTIDGIGPKTVDKLRGIVVLGPPRPKR